MRAIGLGSAVLFVVGSVIGSGIFLTTGGMAAVIPSAPLLLTAWVLGGVLAIAGGLTYAEMGAMFPRSGGVYVFLREAYGPLPAFLYGWAALFVVISGGIAAVAVGFAEYLSYFIPAASPKLIVLSVNTPWETIAISAGQIVAALSILTLGAINYVGVRTGNMVNAVLTAAKVAGLAALPVMALLAWRVHPALSPIVPPGLERPAASFGVAMIAVLWTYEAWYFVTYAAGEIKDPQRNVPRALVGGILVLTTVYLLVNVAYFFALSVDEMKGVTRIAEHAATAMVGPRGATFVALTVWSTILALSGTYEQLFTYVMFASILFSVAAGLALFRLRHTMPDRPRPYRTWGYPVVPLVFIAGATAFVLNTLMERPVQSIAGLGLVALGLPVYWYWRKR